MIVVALLGVAATAVVMGINAYKVDTDPEESVGVEYNGTKDEIAFLNKDAKLADVKRVEGVINIYMFWGAGCPHCKAQWEWLDSIRDKYVGKIAVYGFEVFNNSENRLIMDSFVNAVGDKDIKTVPYTVIGGKSIGGFSTGSTSGKKILDLVEEAQKSKKDIYFDVIKK